MTKACPLCGSRHQLEQRVGEFLVCARCGELLEGTELVWWATPWTRRAYNRRNDKPANYR